MSDSPDALAQSHGRARAFVDAHGDALARARLSALHDRLQLPAVRELLPAPGKSRGSLRQSLEILAILDDLRAGSAPELEAAAAWLARAQGRDGSWVGAPGDDEHSRLVLTGLIAGMLARTPCTRVAVLDAAGDFLGARWSPDQVRSGDFGCIAAFGAFFANHAHELSDAALQWCGRELERAFRGGCLDALRTARVLTLCDARGLPGSRIRPDELVGALLAAQAPDGGWGDEVEPAPLRVVTTLDAALALLRLAPSTR